MALEIGEQDAAWMVSLAGLPGIVSLQPMEGGWDNTNSLLCLDDGSKVVLKAWNSNSVDEVSRVVERHLHLQSNGIPTAVPLELNDKRLLRERAGVAWTLLPYFEGGHLGTDRDSLRSLGETQARMHLIPISECFPETYKMGFDFFEEVIELAGVKGDRSEFIETLTREGESLKSRVTGTLPIGVLHGDLFPDNVIGSGSVDAILDLEEGWIGPLAFDLAMSFVGFGWQGGSPVESRWEALVEGYQSVRRLSEEEIGKLPDLHRYATLAIACWRYWKHNLSEPDANLAKRYVEMVDRLDVDFYFGGAFE